MVQVLTGLAAVAALPGIWWLLRKMIDAAIARSQSRYTHDLDQHMERLKTLLHHETLKAQLTTAKTFETYQQIAAALRCAQGNLARLYFGLGRTYEECNTADFKKLLDGFADGHKDEILKALEENRALGLKKFEAAMSMRAAHDARMSQVEAANLVITHGLHLSDEVRQRAHAIIRVQGLVANSHVLGYQGSRGAYHDHKRELDAQEAKIDELESIMRAELQPGQNLAPTV